MGITPCGYSAIWVSRHDSIIPGGDHRCLWLDLSFVTAFGHNMPAIIRPSARRLTCKDPRIVKNYISRYEKLAKKHKLPQKVADLFDQASYPLASELQITFESLDDLRCKITVEAERKCRKLRMGQVAFSPALQEVNRQIAAYTLLRKK